MTFEYKKPTMNQKMLMQQFRKEFESLANMLKEKLTDSKGKSICLVKLEESSFWLNKAITQNDN